MDALWVVAFVILGIIAVYFIVAYFFALTTSIPPGQCNTDTGTYGVRPGTSGTALVACGKTSCVFTELTLAQAVSQCDTISNVCSAFSFNCATGTMTVIDPTKPFTTAPTTDLYQRRTKVVTVN